jgi:hypothetical protein
MYIIKVPRGTIRQIFSVPHSPFLCDRFKVAVAVCTLQPPYGYQSQTTFKQLVLALHLKGSRLWSIVHVNLVTIPELIDV